MLPFLKPKDIGTVIQTKRHKDGHEEVLREEGEHSPGIMAASEDLIQAIHGKDAKAVADALKAHHEMKMNESDEYGDTDAAEAE